MDPRVIRSIPILLVAALAFAGAFAWMGNEPGVLHAQPSETPVVRAALPGALDAAMGNPYLIADIAERVTPAVVYIEVTWPAPERSSRNPFANDPFFRDFFWFNPWPETPRGPQISRGSGFIISEEGYILTNQHVVGNPGDGQKVTVKLHTPDFQGEVEARIVGADYGLDLAVLQIDKPRGLDKLPTVPLGDSDASRPGEWVIAIGNPYGEQYEHTVTVGVLSAKGREIQIYDSNQRRWKTYTNLMQTDAAINPGNSGGPLINIRGEVIGINTAVNAAAQGIGFAIPINTALDVMEQLITEGRIRRAYLGVELYDLDEIQDRVKQLLGLDLKEGAMITRIEPGTAALEAGLQVYDVILRIGDTPIRSRQDVVDDLAKRKPGDEVVIQVWRRGRTIMVPVILGERPPGI